MSRNRKNHHYHYAEKFTDRARRERRSAMLFPRRTLFAAVLVLLLFGVITATFSINDPVVDSDPAVESGSLLVRVRNAKVSQDRSDDKSFASAATGGKVNLASTGAAQYYYRGEKNSWGATKMTVSSDGWYEYYSASGGAHQFKIATSTSSYDYNYSYVHSGFNSTDVTQVGDYGSNNCYCWYGSAHYIIVYYPNTPINSTGNPKICAATSLPSNVADRVLFGEFFTNNSSATQHTMTSSDSDTYTYSMTLTGGQEHDIYFKVGYGSDNYTKTYKDQYSQTMTYDHCTDWQYQETSGNNPRLATVITGTYTFTFTMSTKKVSVTFPTYSITATKDNSNAVVSASTSTVAIGSSVTLTAPAESTDGYEFVKWEITSGSAKTTAYGNTGTAISESTSNPLTIYPYGTASGVTVRAKYNLKTYTITYHDGSGLPVTGTISNPSSRVPASATKNHGQAYTLTSNTFSRPGYTQVGWATQPNYTSQANGEMTINDAVVSVSYYALGGTYPANENAALDLYPVWRLNSVSVTGITGGSVTGSDTIQIVVTTSVGARYDVTRTLSYTVTRGGVDALSLVTINSSGYFTASEPGEYKITCTVKDTNTTGVVNANQWVTATSGEATIIVRPGVPSVTPSMSGNTGHTAGSFDGTTDHPYKVLLGVPYYFTFSTSNVEGYTYRWSTNPDFSVTSAIIDGATLSTININAAYLVGAATTSLAATEKQMIRVYCEVSCNGQTNKSEAAEIYYYVEKLILDFRLLPYQKIYNTNSGISDLIASYNTGDYTSFTTDLQFSDDHVTYVTKDSFSYPTDLVVSYVEQVTSVITELLYSAGPKYFMLAVSGTISEPEPSTETHPYTTYSTPIHTTVGTVDTAVSRTLYFYNLNTDDSVATLKNYRVMCYYTQGDDTHGYTLGYQAAEDMCKSNVDKAGKYYRVMIPADAKAVCFGILKSDPVSGLYYYGSAALSGSNIVGFTSAAYFGYTAQVALTDSVKVITSSSFDTVSSMKHLSCTTSDTYISIN